MLDHSTAFMYQDNLERLKIFSIRWIVKEGPVQSNKIQQGKSLTFEFNFSRSNLTLFAWKGEAVVLQLVNFNHCENQFQSFPLLCIILCNTIWISIQLKYFWLTWKWETVRVCVEWCQLHHYKDKKSFSQCYQFIRSQTWTFTVQ